ncbi:hypothetical protein BKA93DRAFT_878440 [Sparassis latifolia]
MPGGHKNKKMNAPNARSGIELRESIATGSASALSAELLSRIFYLFSVEVVEDLEWTGVLKVCRHWRIRSLRWEAEGIEALVKSLNFVMPHLTHLTLGAENGDDVVRDHVWKSSRDLFPCLRSLSLSGVDMEWSILSFTSLVGLQPGRLTRPKSMDDFLHLLQASPNLETLHVDHSAPSLVENLEDMDVCEDEPDIPPPAWNLPLPKLQQLRLQDTTFNVKWLLSHLSIPSSTTLSFIYPLEVGTEEYVDVDIISQAIPKDGSLSPILSLIQRLKIVVQRGGVYLDGFGGTELEKPKLIMHFEDDFERDIGYLLPRVLRELGHVFCSSPIVVLEIAGDLSLDENSWRKTLQCFPQLEHLEYNGDTIGLFKALGSSPASPQTQEKIICPQLKRIHVVSGMWKDTVSAMHTGLAYREAQGMRLESLSVRPRVRLNKKDSKA